MLLSRTFARIYTAFPFFILRAMQCPPLSGMVLSSAIATQARTAHAC